ncbi:MAG: sigma-70 family RNA polymerase sigma factor [Psychroflexus sp.]|jgi:RNA polymerase sigma-70 factor (ECF subfamily)|nr:sigma-70 family RNA polymerase sigma factor [Psychroflexus sp.]MDR9447956.1 sigma-70 family RNA polymerase sigma factor [Psychroflexus sp.]
MDLKAIIKQCCKGDLKAQRQIYDLMASKLFAVSLKYSRNYQEAQDNLQDSFIKIYDNIDKFKFKGSFEGWCKRIAINTALARYRKHDVYELFNENQLADKEDVIEEIEDVSLSFLLACVQQLPNRYRLVFNLYVLDGYSHKEIAEKLDISDGTSKSNLARARKILKNKVQKATLEEKTRLKVTHG